MASRRHWQVALSRRIRRLNVRLLASTSGTANTDYLTYWGWQFIQYGDWQTAAIAGQAAIRQQPQAGEGYRILAMAQRDGGQLELAEQTARTGLAREPGNVLLRWFLGDLALRRDHSGRAARWYESALGSPTQDVDTRAALARAWYACGRGGLARSVLEEALAEQPQHAQSLALLGVLEVLASRWVQAETLLNGARDQGLREPWVDFNLAVALAGQGRYTAARMAAERACQAPGPPSIHTQVRNTLQALISKEGWNPSQLEKAERFEGQARLVEALKPVDGTYAMALYRDFWGSPEQQPDGQRTLAHFDVITAQFGSAIARITPVVERGEATAKDYLLLGISAYGIGADEEATAYLESAREDPALTAQAETYLEALREIADAAPV